ncbi:hypothetical protein FSP39_017640 [Pinctada imbricata]|nr:hypothetical protein FSP39_017640 [Pinctada imbricata]
MFGVAPSIVLKYLDRSSARSKFYLGVLNSIAGGIFFGTAILHLLPESIEQLQMYPMVSHSLAYTLVGVGFFLMLITEHVIGLYHSLHSHSSGYENLEGSEKPLQTITKDKNSLTSMQMTSNQSSSDTYGSVFEKEPEQQPDTLTAANKDRDLTDTKHVDCQKEKEMEDDCDRISRLKAFIVLVALSVHMVFEGLAIGLQKTESEVWTLLGVISIHKCMVAFSLGLQLWTFRQMRNILLATAGFSLVAPIGVGIGIAVSEFGGNGKARGIASGVLQSLTTGTFLYITFFEILQKELCHKYDLVKVFWSILGFVLVMGVNLISEDSM